jgi:hypothetical protein
MCRTTIDSMCWRPSSFRRGREEFMSGSNN